MKENLKEIENSLYEKISENLTGMKTYIAETVLEGNCLLIGEMELIQSFTELLEENNVKPKIKESKPIFIMKVNKNTGERKVGIMLFIKKTRRFDKFIMNNIEYIYTTTNYKNTDNLLYIELYEDEAERHVFADFLDEFNEDNIKKEIDEYFNIENTYKNAIKHLRSEHDTESMMYQ